MKHSNSDIISLHEYNTSQYQITLPLGLIGYCQIKATIFPTEEVVYRVNYILYNYSTFVNQQFSLKNYR